MNDNLEKMLKVNKEQAKFYDSISKEDDEKEFTGYKKNKMSNMVTRLWAYLRYTHQEVFESSGIDEKKNNFFEFCLNKKKGGHFLEIGCFRGSRFTMKIIDYAGEYTGIDLSEMAVNELNNKLKENDLDNNAKAICQDLLKIDEGYKFDLIFAHGVLHHFEDSSILFSKLNSILNEDGLLLLSEPSMVNYFYNLIRTLYRPFQSDAEWEWPFTKRTIEDMEKYFVVVDGFGWGRWTLIISLLVPIPILGYFLKRYFRRVVDYELSRKWNKNVWLNSTVVAAYKPKAN